MDGKKIIIALAIISILLIIYSFRTVKVCNGIFCFNVVERYGDNRRAAALIGALNANIVALLRHLRAKYANSESWRGQIVDRCLDNYNPETIFENDPKFGIGTSYTIDKGHKTYLCLRNKTNGALHGHDILLFVTLHELAHMGNENWGHELDFWQIFKFILHEAEEAGIYRPIDYSKWPTLYCGLKIDYNPYYDKGLKAAQ
jgi:hypothetical protein